MTSQELTRRAFIAAATTSAVALTTRVYAVNDAKVVPRKISPNERMNMGAIGCGGKARTDVRSCARENFVAVCDVDWVRGAEVMEALPNAKRYKDYRNMLDDMPEIDAVTVTTPDHTHAPAAYMAMKMGKHVYVQKPLTHTVAEARLLTNTAREMGVATQMGNQGHSGNGCRQMSEMVWSGVIGKVREAHIWTHRPVWANQGRPDPMPPQVIPEQVDWNRWIGSAPWRPYNGAYHPHDWRAWIDFGAGALGDMACHIMDPVYMALKLHDAEFLTVEVIDQKGRNSQTFPITTTIKYSFTARGDMPPVDVYWYDGHWKDEKTGEEIYNRPKWPSSVPAGQVWGDDNSNGSFLVGDDGYITAGEYGGRPRLMPDEKMADYTMPPETIPRIPHQNHYEDWIQACKGGRPACSNFDYSGPLTEMVQFGNLAVVSGKKLRWDNSKGVVTNVPNASEIVSKEYRKGWELPI